MKCNLKPFVRSDEYLAKLTVDALTKNVILDVKIHIVLDRTEIRAWSKETGFRLIFPNHLLHEGYVYSADVIEVSRIAGNIIFYTVYKESLCLISTGEDLLYNSSTTDYYAGHNNNLLDHFIGQSLSTMNN